MLIHLCYRRNLVSATKDTKHVFKKSEFRTKYSLLNLLCAIQSQQENNADSRIWTFGILIDQWRLWTSIYILRIFCEIHSAMRHCDEIYTVKLQAVDRSTVQFWKLSAKSHSTKASNFPFINIMKMLGCATNRDSLLLAILWTLLIFTDHEGSLKIFGNLQVSSGIFGDLRGSSEPSWIKLLNPEAQESKLQKLVSLNMYLRKTEIPGRSITKNIQQKNCFVWLQNYVIQNDCWCVLDLTTPKQIRCRLQKANS